MSSGHEFSRHERLRLNRQFARVFARKCSASDDVLMVYVAKNDLAWSRLGLRVGKRMGNAVRRNYLRRRIREAFRTAKNDIPVGFDIICVARPGAKDPSRDLGRSLCALVVKATRAHGGGSKCRLDSGGVGR
ncbi:MAG: ribonuclease P protein component [Planctomycetes bacterium]|nr:ribonuclease P protein component [Planctomycetota bacterium]